MRLAATIRVITDFCGFLKPQAELNPPYYCPVARVPRNSRNMTPYASLLGKRVEAHYRASDLQLSAAGTLVGDSGKFICIEDEYVQNGHEKTMRLEIPYDFIFRVIEKAQAADPSAIAPPQAP